MANLALDTLTATPGTPISQTLPSKQGIDPEQADIEGFTATAGPLRRGMRAAANNIGASLNGIIASTGDALGLTQFAEDRYAEARRYTDFANSVDHEVRDYGAVKDFNSLIDYVAGNVGKGIVSSLPAIGLAIGLRRPVAGVLAGSFPQEAGEQALSLRDNPNVMANTTPGQRLGNAAAKGGINALLELGGAEGQAARKLLKPGAKGIGKAVVKGTLGEGVTEAAQETVGQGLEQQLDPSKAIDPHQVINAGLAGAVGGAAIGGGAHALAVAPGAIARTADELKTRLGSKEKPMNPDPEHIPEEAAKLDTKEQIMDFLNKYDEKFQTTYGKMKDPAERQAFYDKAKDTFYNETTRPHIDKVLAAGKAVKEFAQTKLKKSEMDNRKQYGLDTVTVMRQAIDKVGEGTFRSKVEEELKWVRDRGIKPDEAAIVEMVARKIVNNEDTPKPSSRGPADDDILDFMSNEMNQDARNSASPEQLQGLQKLVSDFTENPSAFKHVHRSLKKVFGDKFDKITDYAIERTTSSDEQMKARKREIRLATMPQDQLEEHRNELATNIMRTYAKPDYSVKPELRKAMLDEMGPRILDFVDGNPDPRFEQAMKETTGANFDKAMNELEQLKDIKPTTSGRAFEGQVSEAPMEAGDEARVVKDEGFTTQESVLAGSPAADQRLNRIYSDKSAAEKGAEALRSEYGPKTMKFSVASHGPLLGEEGYSGDQFKISAEDADQEKLTTAELRRVREVGGQSGLENGMLIVKTEQHPAGVKINLVRLTHLMMSKEGQQTQEGGERYVADMFSRGMSSFLHTMGDAAKGFAKSAKRGDGLDFDKNGNWTLPDNTKVAVMGGKTYTYGDIKVYRLTANELAGITDEDIKFEEEQIKAERTNVEEELHAAQTTGNRTAAARLVKELSKLNTITSSPSQLNAEAINRVTDKARNSAEAQTYYEPHEDNQDTGIAQNAQDQPSRDVHERRQYSEDNKSPNARKLEEDTGRPLEQMNPTALEGKTFRTPGAPEMRTPAKKNLPKGTQHVDQHINRNAPIPENLDLIEKKYGLRPYQKLSDADLVKDIPKNTERPGIAPIAEALGNEVGNEASKKIIEAMYPGVKKSMMENKAQKAWNSEEAQERRSLARMKQLGLSDEDITLLKQPNYQLELVHHGPEMYYLAAKGGYRVTIGGDTGVYKTPQEAMTAVIAYDKKSGGFDKWNEGVAKRIREELAKKDLLDSLKESAPTNDAKYSMVENKSVSPEEFSAQLMKKYPYGVTTKLGNYGNAVELEVLHINKDMRGKGLGSRVMSDIITYADKAKKGIILYAQPSKDSDQTLEQLEKFYTGFGFRAFDMEDRQAPGQMTEMYREPIGTIDEESRRYDTTGAEGDVGQAVPDLSGEVQFSTQNVGSGDATPEQQQAARDYVKRVLGDKAAVFFEKMAHAGEFARINDIETIKIALNALDPQSVAYHEALHALFARLIIADKKTANTLLRAAGSAPIVARLRQLLKDHPKALEQLKDPEERLAYMYQFSALGEKGLVQIGPDTRTAFGKVKSFLRKISAIWSDEMGDAMAVEKAGELLDAFHQGKFADRSTVAEVLRDRFPMDPEEKARKIMPALGKFMDKFIWTASGALRDTNDPALINIANKFHSPIEGGEPGFLQTRHTTFNGFMNRVNDALKGLNNEQLRNVMIELQSGKEPTSQAGRALRGVLDNAHSYLQKAGVKRFVKDEEGKVVYKKGSGEPELEDIGFIENYFPRVSDSKYVKNHKDEFIELLRKHNIQSPEDVWKKYSESVDEGSPKEEDYVLGLSYYTPSTNERTLNNIPDAELAPFLAKDIVGVMSQYLARAARRGEYTKRFGNSGEVITKAFKEAGLANPDGTLKPESKVIGEAVQAMEGTLGANMSQELKNIYGALTTYQNIRLLPLALFSSFVDPLGIVVRGGTMKEAGGAFIRGIRELAGFKDDDAYQLAKTIGAINTANDAQVVGDMYSSQFMPNIQKRINDKFFRMIGMESYNRSMRVAAAAAAEQFLIRHGTKPTEHSERYLSELNLTKDDISIVNDKLVLSEKVTKAMNQWVDQAILRPNAALRPVYMSDPNWILISHLKQYTYMFQKVIIARVHHELQHGNYTPLYGLMGYVPLIIASDMLRAGLTPSTGDDKPDWDVADWLWRGVQRAGFFGPGQFAIDSSNDLHKAHFGIESIIGPTGQQLLDFLRASLSGQGIGNELKKAIPGARLVS